MTLTDYVVEPMKEADLDAVMAIERACFPAPWSRQVFLEEMTRAWAYLDVLRRVRDGQVVGFCNYWRVADELQLLNVSVHPDERRRGCASRLMEHLLDYGRRSQCRLVTLEVRKTNEAAQRLYRRFRFKAVGLRAGYYADNGEDAVLMELALP
jgi:ribosomal-protein-alanine N-acetyltransferase